MITTDESTTRVERVEARMWVEAGVPAFCALMVAIYMASLVDRPVEYLLVVAVIALGILVFVSGIRRHQVCIIGPSRISYGFPEKEKMWWLDRDQVGSVLVRKDLLLQVRFYGTDGKMIASHVFGSFDPKELRQAFESAGIPVR